LENISSIVFPLHLPCFKVFLVGGFNPFENMSQVWMKIKEIFETTNQFFSLGKKNNFRGGNIWRQIIPSA